MKINTSNKNPKYPSKNPSIEVRRDTLSIQSVLTVGTICDTDLLTKPDMRYLHVLLHLTEVVQ
jgi:hypothetical protein